MMNGRSQSIKEISRSTHHGGDAWWHAGWRSAGWQSNSGLVVSRLKLVREGSRFDSEGGWGKVFCKTRDLGAFFLIFLLA